MSSAGPSLSLVFAEPQLGSPSTSSAAAILGGKEEAKLEEDVQAEQAAVDAEEPEIQAPIAQIKAPVPLVLEELPTPTLEEPPSTSVDSPPIPSPSWFGSIGRSKGKESLVSLPITVPKSPSIRAETAIIEEPQQGAASSLSSVDEQVPTLEQLQVPLAVPFLSSPQLSESPLEADDERPESPPQTVRERLNSLNPSTSRFVISLPILTRWGQTSTPAAATSGGYAFVPLAMPDVF